LPIGPDTKDWTWVLERPCPECGFDASTLPREQIVPLIEANGRAWASLLEGSPTALRERPGDDRWSVLEYACHVRDVFQRYDERLQLMVSQENPSFANWDQDRSALDDRYNEQDPGAVAGQIVVAADRLGSSFRRVTEKGWERVGRRSDGAEFTVESFGRYMIHDPIHHLHDVNVDVTNLMPPPPPAP
jgi:hypothetical protein